MVDMRRTLPLAWYRFFGITSLCLLGYIVVIGIFGNVDISGLLPNRMALTIQYAWPQMPFFTVEREPVNGGRGEEIIYTVPTRQLTPQEIALLSGKPIPAAAKAKQAPAQP